MKYTVPLLLAVAFLSEARAQDVKRNIPYAKAHERQVLDVYSPQNAKNQRRMILEDDYAVLDSAA